MPGILPMKLIKCGNSQTRIAQACDRCRSKKIRCDGVRPCCSQCANVGFECKTSDKLSRRAFPRGYTESLEERVRQLEAEVRGLKELLDAKEEQLDMLSRIHSFSPYSPPPSAASGGPHHRGMRASPAIETPSSSGAHDDCEESFTMQESSFLVSDETGSFYLGGSSGLPFVDFFKQKLRDCGRLKHDFDIGAFFVNQTSDRTQSTQPFISRAPSRLSSDHLVTSFFQEYQPLFPIVHRPSILVEYEKLMNLSETSAAPNEVLSSHSLAQLYLIFAITARNAEFSTKAELESYDQQWQQALNSVLLETSLETVQCLVLAQLYSFVIGDYQKLSQYRSLCVGIVLRMGLNRSQKNFLAQNALMSEMSKRTFWCVYCLDSFAASLLGLPRLLKDEDISVEYPSDIDDEYISRDGFGSTPPGDFTKISSAIALFRCSRVLANVLDSIYPTTLAHEQTYRRLKELEDELDSWKSGLAPHLRLEFVNGVPATKMVHNRSPLLVLAYHYVRVLIHRPIVSCGDGSSKTSASFLAMTESSKHIVQIIQLFSERKLRFSFCLNKNHLLVVSGFAILFGAVNYQQKGSLAKESEKLVSGVVHELELSGYAKVAEFKSIAETIVQIEQLVTRDLGTIPAKLASQSPPANIASPPSPTSPTQGVPPLRRRVASVTTKINTGPFSNIRRANSQHITSDAGYRVQPSPRRTNTGPYESMGRIQTPHNGRPLPHQSTSSVDAIGWPFESVPVIDSINYPPANNPKQKTKNGAPMTTDEWTRILTLMDAAQGAQIYGGSEHALVSPASISTPTITRYMDQQEWSMDDYSSCMGEQKLQAYSAAAPSVSSFSTLSDEGFTNEDRSGGSPGAVDLPDLSAVDGQLFGEEDLRGILGYTGAHWGTA